MRYAELSPGTYVVRTRELSWARKLSGVICLVKAVKPDGSLHLQMTDDCAPVGGVLSVSKEADDGYWYDVSDLIAMANSVILPSIGECSYTSAVEANYRNFVVGSNVTPLVGDEADGNICLIGERLKNGRVVYSKVGYFVVGSDVNGYVAAYQGFCEYCGPDSPRKLQLRILNLTNTERAFYPASVVVDACHAAYSEDCRLAEQYREEIRESIITSSTEAGFDTGDGGLEFSKLELESAVC